MNDASEHARVRWEPWLMGVLEALIPDGLPREFWPYPKDRSRTRARLFRYLSPWRSPWDGCLVATYTPERSA